jgi:RNA polymerase sigma-70 factor (ECF subfamily)
MENLIELVRRYQRAKGLTKRLHLADKIISAVSPRLEAFILRACKRSVAEDLLQETLVKIARNLDGFRGESEIQFRAWCYKIARNMLRDHFRKKDIAERLEPFDSEDVRNVINASSKQDPLSRAEKVDLDEALSLLEQAKPPCRGYLWSRYIRGMGIKEIAKEYGLKYDAARMQVKRCLELAVKLAAQHL